MCLSKGNEAYVYVGICTQMFPEALFVIAISWKQLKCPSTGEWMARLMSLQWNTTQWKRPGVLTHAKAWANLKIFMLSERSHPHSNQKSTQHVILFTGNSRLYRAICVTEENKVEMTKWNEEVPVCVKEERSLDWLNLAQCIWTK